MQKILPSKLLISLCSLILLQLPLTASATTPAQISQTINKIVASSHENLNAGIIVANLSTGKIVYEKNPTRLFLPASNLKLFTAYAALKKLGPAFTFQTAVYADTSHLQNGILNGNVYFKFSGDPQLTLPQLNNLVSALTRAGIQKINGAVIVDNSAYDSAGLGPGWMWDDQNYCYSAPINALNINHNCFSINLLPADHPSALSLLEPVQPPLLVNINNQIRTTSPNSVCQINIESNESNNYTLNGCISSVKPGIKKTATTLEIATINAPLYASKLLDQLLQNNHITVTQGVQFGRLNSGNNLIAVINSKPLSKIIADMLKPSDNLIANSLFKKLGEVTSQRIGSWETGKEAMQTIMRVQLLIEPRSQIIVDGSGDSRYDLVTPQQILMILLSVYRNPTLADIYIPALPIAGIDGTLHSRMTSPGIKGKVLAKTGSMEGVSSLSGFIKTSHKQTLAFVIVFNNFTGSENKYRAIQDRICEYLVKI